MYSKSHDLKPFLFNFQLYRSSNRAWEELLNKRDGISVQGRQKTHHLFTDNPSCYHMRKKLFSISISNLFSDPHPIEHCEEVHEN